MCPCKHCIAAVLLGPLVVWIGVHWLAKSGRPMSWCVSEHVRVISHSTMFLLLMRCNLTLELSSGGQTSWINTKTVSCCAACGCEHLSNSSVGSSPMFWSLLTTWNNKKQQNIFTINDFFFQFLKNNPSLTLRRRRRISLKFIVFIGWGVYVGVGNNVLRLHIFQIRELILLTILSQQVIL